MSTVGSLSLLVAMKALIGGETKAVNILRTHATAYTEIIADVMVNLAGGQAAGSPTTLWQSSVHATTTNPLPQQFRFGMILPDPDAIRSSALSIDVELTATLNNSTTHTDIRGVRRITRDAPMVLGTSLCGLDFTNIGDITTPGTVFSHITRIRARNPNAADGTGANDVRVRLLLMR